MSETKPAICREEGLSCAACVHATARQTSSLLRLSYEPAIRKVFTQIYPDPACSPMVRAFVEAYQ